MREQTVVQSLLDKGFIRTGFPFYFKFQMWRKELRAIEKFDVLEGDIVKEAVFNDAVFDVIGLEEIET